MKPRIFIGSSVKAKGIAEMLQRLLTHDTWPTVWHHAFPLSLTTIDTLLDKLADQDFSIFVFADDDITTIKGSLQFTTRDNVVFESGIFMGLRGKEKTFIVTPRNLSGMHLPSDLNGFTVSDYDTDFAKVDLKSALGPVVTDILQAIDRIRLADKTQILVTPQVSIATDPKATYPLKLYFHIRNTSRLLLSVDDVFFEIGSGIDVDTKSNKRFNSTTFRLDMLLFSTAPNIEHWEFQTFIEPQKQTKLYIPMASPFDKTKLEEALKNKTAGILKFRISLFDRQISSKRYEERF